MKKNYIYNLLLTVWNLLIPLVSFPYAARVLGPEGIGKAQFIFLLSQYISILAALGIPIYGTREVARLRHDPAALQRLTRELLTINLLTGTGLFLALVLAVESGAVPAADKRLYYGGGILILLSFTSLDWLYTGLERFRALALCSVATKTASVAALFLFVKTRLDTGTYLAIQVGTLLLYNGINLWGVRPLLRGRLHGLHYRPHFKSLFFIFGTTIASTMYTTFDSVLLGLLSSKTAVGYYTAATKISKISLPVVMAYGGVSLPRITAAVQSGDASLDAILRRSYAYVILLGVPATVGLFVFAPHLVYLFSGPEFSPAVRTLRIVSVYPLLIGLGYFWGYQVALPLGRERLLLTAAVAGMIASLVLNGLLVPHFRQDGAAAAGAVAECVVGALYFLLVRRSTPFRAGGRLFSAAALSAAPFFAFSFLPGEFWGMGRWLTFGISAAACAVVYGATQLFLFKNEPLRAGRASLLALRARFAA